MAVHVVRSSFDAGVHVGLMNPSRDLTRQPIVQPGHLCMTVFACYKYISKEPGKEPWLHLIRSLERMEMKGRHDEPISQTLRCESDSTTQIHSLRSSDKNGRFTSCYSPSSQTPFS